MTIRRKLQCLVIRAFLRTAAQIDYFTNIPAQAHAPTFATNAWSRALKQEFYCKYKVRNEWAANGIFLEK